jgi:predicted NAD-dependent protein-ADP-ribosyltransferase YbiA (DUF1768 family)
MARTRARGREGRGAGGRGGGGRGGGGGNRSAAAPPKRKRADSLSIPLSALSGLDIEDDEDDNPPPAKKRAATKKEKQTKSTPAAPHKTKRPAVADPEGSGSDEDDGQGENKRQRVDSPFAVETETQKKTSATIKLAARVARADEKAIRTQKQLAETTRPHGSRRVMFDVHRAKLVEGVEQGNGYIFFYPGMRRYGGPFAFLSNFYPSKFRVEKVHKTHTFVTMEQFYQYCKAMSFRLAPEVLVVHTEGFAPLSSYQVCNLVLTLTGALVTAEFVRNFISCATKQHPGWFKLEKYWAPAVSKFLEQGLQAKFAADENFMDLLQRTGNYELVEASPNDKKCGIGFAANVAFDHIEKWEDNKDCNLLGQALMKVRDASAVATIGPGIPNPYDRAFYNDLELQFWKWVCDQQATVAKAKTLSSKPAGKTPAKRAPRV